MRRPIRFLHLATFYPPYSFGGDAIYLYRLAHALGDEGHKVDVVHCADSYHMLHPGAPELRFSDHPNVAVHTLRSGWGWVSPLLTHQTGRPYLKQRRIQSLLAENRYDVIHFHNMSLLGPGALAIAPLGRTIKLYTTHDHWLICPNHVLWKFNRKPCDGAACFRCALLARRPPQLWRYTGLLARASRHVDRFLAPSRFTARMHADRGFPRPMDVLPLFIDRAEAERRETGARPHDRPYFLFVGRLEEIKGLRGLISLWKNLRDADLLVAGTGTAEPALKALAGSNPSIRFLGALPQGDLGPLYSHAVACVVPSATYEIFPTVTIEAFARKTPVIVRDLGGLPEIVQDSGGGFSYRTDQELAQALERLRSSPTLRAELGQNGYQAFVRLWSREAHLRRYFELLEEIAWEKCHSIPWDPARLAPREGPLQAATRVQDGDPAAAEAP